MAERCEICRPRIRGNVVEVLHGEVGQLVRCDEPMEIIGDRTMDVGQEKHLRVVDEDDEGMLVKVGSVPHAMEEEHFIEWIAFAGMGSICRTYLQPGDAPQGRFAGRTGRARAMADCNVPGIGSA